MSTITPLAETSAAAPAPAPQLTSARRAVGNSALLSAYYVLETGLLFGLNLLLARALGPADFGKLAFALSYGLLLTALDPGFNLVIVKFAARDPQLQNPWVRAGLSVRPYLALIGASLILLPLPFHPYLRANALLIVMLAGSELVRSLTLAMCAVLRGFQAMIWEPLIVGTERLLLLGGCAWLLAHGHGPRSVGMMFFAARLTSLIVALLVLKLRWGGIPFVFRSPLVRPLVREAYPLALMSLIDRVNLSLAPLVLAFTAGEAAAGLFQAASRIVMFPVLMCGVVSMGIFPAMSAAHQDSAQTQKLYRYGLRMVWHILLPLAVVTGIFSRQLMGAVFGPAFVPAAPLLSVLTVYYLLYAFNFITYYLLTATNEQKFALRLGTVNLALSLTFGVALMRVLGPIGAAVGMTSVAFVIAVAYLIRLRRVHLRALASPRDVLQWVAFACLIAVAFWLKPPVHGWAGLLALAACVMTGYLLLLVVTRGFLPQEAGFVSSLGDRIWPRS